MKLIRYVLERLHEIVDWVIADGMYCIINMHHDTGRADGCEHQRTTMNRCIFILARYGKT